MNVGKGRAGIRVPLLLGDVLDVKHGFAFKGEFFGAEGPFVIVTPGSFFEEGGFRVREDKEKRYSGEVPDGFVLGKGTLIVAMTEQAEGLLGSAALVPGDDLYLHNQRIGRIEIRRPDLADKTFIYYLFNTQGVRQQIRASATGTKVRHTAPERIRNVKVQMPSLAVQRKTAAILSAYDDLIENNLRRIRVLEEMARVLYREWFVEFRFPGHERVRLVQVPYGSLPEGWKGSTIGALAEDVRRGVSPTEVPPDTPYIGLEHLPRKSITLCDWGLASEVASTKLEFRKGEILFGKIRPYFHKVGVAPVDGVCSSDAIVLRVLDGDLHALVTSVVSSDEFVAYATRTSQGTKMPRADWKVLRTFPVAVPPKALLDQFRAVFDPVLGLMQNLMFRNRALRVTRDLVLPRLISGGLDVSDLDIAVPEAAA